MSATSPCRNRVYRRSALRPQPQACYYFLYTQRRKEFRIAAIRIQMCQVRASIRENRKAQRADHPEVPEVRQKSRAHDFRGGNSIQRLGLVRDGLQRQEFRRHVGRRLGRRRSRKIRRLILGFQILRRKIAGLQSERCQDRRIEIRRREIWRLKVLQRKKRAEEKEVERRSDALKLQRLQIFPELTAEFRILQRQFHRGFQEAQLVSGVVRFTRVYVRPQAFFSSQRAQTI